MATVGAQIEVASASALISPRTFFIFVLPGSRIVSTHKVVFCLIRRLPAGRPLRGKEPSPPSFRTNLVPCSAAPSGSGARLDSRSL